MKNKKGINITFVLIFISVSLAVFSITTYNKNLQKNKSSNDYHSNEQLTEPVPEKIIYVVKEYNGKIAVFEKGNEKPFKVTDVHISNLPEVDKQILKLGIETDNKKNLNTILEDYCS